jgi:hypothetical protein
MSKPMPVAVSAGRDESALRSEALKIEMYSAPAELFERSLFEVQEVYSDTGIESVLALA